MQMLLESLILRFQCFSGLPLCVITCSRVKGQTSKAVSIFGTKTHQDGTPSEASRGVTCLHDFRGCLRPPSVSAAAQGEKVPELCNYSKSGHTRAQSGFAACGARDVQAVQEALSGQLMRQACQGDGSTPLGTLMIQEGHGELERYTT